MSFAFTEVVSSWNAKTSPGTWVQSEVKAQLDNGREVGSIPRPLDANDPDFHRTSVGGQGDADGFIAVDTFFTKDHPAVAYRLRLTIFRRGTDCGAGAGLGFALQRRRVEPEEPEEHVPERDDDERPADRSRPAELLAGDPSRRTTPSSTTAERRGAARRRPRWSSSTGKTRLERCTRRQCRDVLGRLRDPDVDYTARFVYDYRYQGAGNWPFNTAYAERGLVGDVTMLHNLSEAEPFIRAGIPLVASIAWSSNKLDTAIEHEQAPDGDRRLTGDGRVIAYDPASDTNAQVRHVYDREQFERAWIPASGGIVVRDSPARLGRRSPLRPIRLGRSATFCSRKRRSASEWTSSSAARRQARRRRRDRAGAGARRASRGGSGSCRARARRRGPARPRRRPLRRSAAARLSSTTGEPVTRASSP